MSAQLLRWVRSRKEGAEDKPAPAVSSTLTWQDLEACMRRVCGSVCVCLCAGARLGCLHAHVLMCRRVAKRWEEGHTGSKRQRLVPFSILQEKLSMANNECCAAGRHRLHEGRMPVMSSDWGGGNWI
eukprot:1153766-Pelagomonas_calceolata.AAC.6